MEYKTRRVYQIVGICQYELCVHAQWLFQITYFPAFQGKRMIKLAGK